MKYIRDRTLVNRTMLFAAFTLLALILAGSSLSIVAQGSGEWAITKAQQAVRERITNREGGRDTTVLFNNDAQTDSKLNRDVRVRGTGTFSRNNNSRNNNSRNNDGQSRNFSYEVVTSNRNRNMSGIRYDWKGDWYGSRHGNYSGGGNNGGGGRGNGGDNNGGGGRSNGGGNNSGYGGGNRPDGRVSYSGPIMNRHSDKSLDVTGQSMQEGANIQQWGYADQANQNWDVVDLGHNEAAIISRHSGMALTVQGGRDNNGANIIQRNWNGSPQQRWRLEQVGGDYYRIVSVDNGKCLDVTEQGKQNGANIQLWDYANQANQQWRLKR